MSARWPITNADQVRAYVAVTHAACPRCGYHLAGLRDPICPECGTQLSVAAFCRRRWYQRKAPTEPRSTLSALRILAVLNILLAAAILASSLAHHGELPILSWLAPGILGAFAFSIQYVAVFAKYCPTRHDPVENWGERTAGLILIIQVAGLILMWA